MGFCADHQKWGSVLTTKNVMKSLHQALLHVVSGTNTTEHQRDNSMLVRELLC